MSLLASTPSAKNRGYSRLRSAVTEWTKLYVGLPAVGQRQQQFRRALPFLTLTRVRQASTLAVMSRRSRAEPEEPAAWKAGDKAWVRYDKPFECELVARRGGKYGEWTVRWENGDVEPKSVPERLLLRTGPDSEDVSDSSKASSPEQPKEAPRALTRRRPSKPSDADMSHANDVGEQIWLKVLESETKKRHASPPCKTYSNNPVPLDLAKVDELLESCSPDVLPLETTAFRLPLHNPTIEALGLDAIQRKDMEALRFSSRAADRPSPYMSRCSRLKEESLRRAR